MKRVRSTGKSWRAGRGARDEAVRRKPRFRPAFASVLHVLALLAGNEVLRQEINPIFTLYHASMTATLPLF